MFSPGPTAARKLSVTRRTGAAQTGESRKFHGAYTANLRDLSVHRLSPPRSIAVIYEVNFRNYRTALPVYDKICRVSPVECRKSFVHHTITVRRMRLLNLPYTCLSPVCFNVPRRRTRSVLHHSRHRRLLSKCEMLRFRVVRFI